MNAKELKEKHKWLKNYDKEKIKETIDSALQLYYGFLTYSSFTLNQQTIEEQFKTQITYVDEKFEKLNETMAHSSNKITDVSNNLFNIFAMSNKSVVKGALSEHILENIIETYFCDLSCERVATQKNCGDYILKISDEDVIIDMKNYSTSVPRKEIEKLKDDIKLNNKKYGMLIASKSIAGKKRFEFEEFDKTKYMVYIPNCNEQAIIWAILFIKEVIYLFKKNKEEPINNKVSVKDKLKSLSKITEELYNDFKNSFESISNLYDLFCKKKKKINDDLDDLDNSISSVKENIKSLVDLYTGLLHKSPQN